MTEYEKQHWDLSFSADRSIRYFERRHAFFANCNRLILILGLLGYMLDVVLGPAARLFDVPWTAIVALGFVLGIGFDTTTKAYKYQELKRRACEIEILLNSREPSDGLVRDARCQLLRIQQDEPPVKQALNVMCHNEAVQALGVDKRNLHPVRWYKRWLAQFYSFANDSELSDLAVQTP